MITRYCAYHNISVIASRLFKVGKWLHYRSMTLLCARQSFMFFFSTYRIGAEFTHFDVCSTRAALKRNWI